MVGFELMDSARFGQTQFQERLTFQRGLEGELTRSITALAAVQTARVHLALPNQNGFFREQQKPSASVLLTLHPGRTLDRAQIAGIVHLVSSQRARAEPEGGERARPDRRAAVGAGDAQPAAGLDAQQLQYVNQIEAGYTKRILDMLEPVVGRDNLRATVDRRHRLLADRGDLRGVQAQPGRRGQRRRAQPADQRAARQQRRRTPTRRARRRLATSRRCRPPRRSPARRSRCRPPRAAARGGNSRRDAVTNYEVDKTVRVTRNATGTVKRLNAAVVVNHRSVTDAKGKTTTTPLSRRGDREADRAGAREHRLQAGARRLGQGDQRAVPGRGRRPKVEHCRCGSSPGSLDLLRAARRAGRAGAGGAAGVLRPDPPGAEGRARAAAAAGARRAARTPWSPTTNALPDGTPPALPAPQAPSAAPRRRARAGQGEPGRGGRTSCAAGSTAKPPPERTMSHRTDMDDKASRTPRSC